MAFFAIIFLSFETGTRAILTTTDSEWEKNQQQQNFHRGGREEGLRWLFLFCSFEETSMKCAVSDHEERSFRLLLYWSFRLERQFIYYFVYFCPSMAFRGMSEKLEEKCEEGRSKDV